MAEKLTIQDLPEIWDEIKNADLIAATRPVDYPDPSATPLDADFFVNNIAAILELIKEKVKSIDGLVAGNLKDIVLGLPSDGVPSFSDGLLDISELDNATDIISKINEVLKYLAMNSQGDISTANLSVKWVNGGNEGDFNEVYLCYDDDADVIQGTIGYCHDENAINPVSIKISLSEIRSPDSGTLSLNRRDVTNNTDQSLGTPILITSEDNTNNTNPELELQDFKNDNQWYSSLIINSLIGYLSGLYKFHYDISGSNSKSIFLFGYNSAGSGIELNSVTASEGVSSVVLTSGLENYKDTGSYTLQIAVDGLYSKVFPKRASQGKNSVFLEAKIDGSSRKYVNADPTDAFVGTSVSATTTDNMPDPDQGAVNVDVEFTVDEEASKIINECTLSLYDHRTNYTEEKITLPVVNPVVLNNVVSDKQTDMKEVFTDEVRRLKAYDKTNIIGVYDTDASFSAAGNVFDSTLSLITNWATEKAAVVYGGSLRHQAQDFTGNVPAGLDYSSLTGDGMFVRRFEFGGNISTFKIDINGIEASDLASKVEVHVKFPSATVWINAVTKFNGNDTWNGGDDFVKGAGAGSYTTSKEDNSKSTVILVNPGSNTADKVLVMLVIKDQSVVINSIDVEPVIAYTAGDLKVFTRKITSTDIANKYIDFPEEVVEPTDPANIVGFIKSGGNIGEHGEEFNVNNDLKRIEFSGYMWDNVLVENDQIRFEYKPVN